MKAGVFTLGCKVNTYESNVILNMLKEKGYTISNKDLDLCIINTCTVTNSADRKSRQLINRVRRENKKAILIVMGCMVQIKKENIENLEKIDILIGNNNKTKIFDYIEEFKKTKEKQIHIEDVKNTCFEDMCAINFNQSRAFVKIQDGCNNFCTYCIIPYARGNIKSKSIDKVIKEVKTLTKAGYKEIVLTGIHTGKYGINSTTSLYELLLELVKIDKLERLRISSIEINEVSREIIKLIKENHKLAKHLHIPLQSASSKVLKDMNRHYSIEDFKEKIEFIKKEIPDINITTDLIVGFPTETKEHFNETVNNIKELPISKIHVFPFSLRKGTKAEKLKNIVTDKQKKDRVKKILNISKQKEIEYMNDHLNKEVEVLFEQKKDNYYVGHTSNYLLIKTKKEVDLNIITKVKIKSIAYPCCIAE